jgi:uncharacterized membrane protein YkgB
LKWRNIAFSVSRTLICSTAMGAVVWAVACGLIPSEGRSFYSLLTGLLVSIGAGILIYVILSFLTKSPELEAAKGLIMQGRKGIQN